MTVAGQAVALRAKEFDLLLALAENQGIVLSREKLLDLVWGFDFYGETRTVDVHVAHVRAKLGANQRRRDRDGVGRGVQASGGGVATRSRRPLQSHPGFAAAHPRRDDRRVARPPRRPTGRGGL